MHVWESVKDVQYYCVACACACGRLDFKHIVDKHIMHFISKVDKINNDVVQQYFSNLTRGDKFKRLCKDYGFIHYMIVC